MKLEPWIDLLILLQPQNKPISYNGLKVNSRAASKIPMQLDLIGTKGDPQTSPNLSLSWTDYTLAKNSLWIPLPWVHLCLKMMGTGFGSFGEKKWTDKTWLMWTVAKKQRISTLRSLQQLTMPLPYLAFIPALLKPFKDFGGHEPPVFLHTPAINLSLLRTPRFLVCLASLCIT